MEIENNSPENAGDQDEFAGRSDGGDLGPQHLAPGEADRIAQLVERSSLGTPEAKELRASVPDDVAARIVARVDELAREAIRPACGVLVTHDRHVLGDVSHPIHCHGYDAPEDQELSYVAALQLWETENEWAGKYGPLLHHARVLARKLDKNDDAPAALSSAYLQAITRLEKMRPASAGGGPTVGDGLNPPGQQPSLFSPMDDE